MHMLVVASMNQHMILCARLLLNVHLSEFLNILYCRRIVF